MLRAEFSLAPLLFLAAFVVVSSLAKRKQQRGTPSRPALGGTPETEPRAGFMTELRRAMEELQQVQQQQQAAPPPEVTSASVSGSSIDSWQMPRAPQTPQEKIAAAWLAKQKQRKALAPQGRMRASRPALPFEDDDADKTSEDVVSLEVRDYDDEAERIVEARRQAAEHRAVRVDESSEGLSTLQQARRASRPDLAIGGVSEHAAWHGEIGKAVETAKPARPASRMGKFADGTARSAIILGEILQPPVGQRDA